jgi:hypothetical protein
VAGPATRRLAQLRAELAQLDAERRVMVAQIEALERLAMDEELTDSQESINLRSKMHAMPPLNRLRRSKAFAQASTEPDPCALAANAHGMTMSDLAKRLKVTPSYLSQLRHGKKQISMVRALEIEKLTGFKATKKNWPRLGL